MTNLKNIAVALASIVIFSNITNAQSLKASYSVNAEDPLKVKYLGEDGEYLLFHVTLQSTNPSNTVFAIDDKEEGELYSSALVSNFKVHTVKVEKRDDGQVLNFKLISGKKTYLKSFSINTTLVETVTVAEKDITKL
ncbi:MAG: hypothetical protein ABIN01_11725 [Ferruginibacter sp.]